MKTIFLFEPNIASDNIGDNVITDSIKREMNYHFDKNFCVEFPTHTPLSNRYMYFMGKPDEKFVCGSNIIVSHIFRMVHLKQWMLNVFTAFNMKNTIFIGVGAQSYNMNLDWITKFLYKLFFNKNVLHSVRDSYTESCLKKIGIKNVINTGCPTMWCLIESHCNKIPQEKTNNVVFTLTDYKQNVDQDRAFVKVLLEKYENVYFWPQGRYDYEYYRRLNLSSKIKVIAPNLAAYDDFLIKTDTDFIGTRLHGGIRALQKGRRTLILGVDNRALELQKDFNLPVVEREDISAIVEWIENSYKTLIKLPLENIKLFKKQFD